MLLEAYQICAHIHRTRRSMSLLGKVDGGNSETLVVGGVCELQFDILCLVFDEVYGAVQEVLVVVFGKFVRWGGPD